MAKTDGLKKFFANTSQENERILYESCRKHKVQAKSNEDFEKLFMKLNYICQIKSIKKEAQLNSWYNNNVVSYTYGPIFGFPPGSWWGIRMDCSRDRVHDPFDENVQSGPFGVTSICTSSVNLNEDVDFGNYLTLTGQKYFNGKLDKDPLIKNYESQIPVRLIRSYNLLNEFAPKTGYRYDGLYVVTSFWIGINSDSTKYYKFALLRLSNQEAPLWSAKQSLLNTSKLSSISQPTSTYLQHCVESSPSSMYEFKKYSHSSEPIHRKRNEEKSNVFLQSSTFVNKSTDEKEKSVSESAIVTRHVFKKVNSNTECTANVLNMSAISENKTLSHIGNQRFKTRNTNISIRTGLYNSSHSTEHDVKKNILLPFCRTSKSLKTNQHTENSNLSSKDTSKALDGKAQITHLNEFPKRVNYACFNTLTSELEKIKMTKNTSREASTNKDIAYYKNEFNTSHEEITNNSKNIYESTVNFSGMPTNPLNLINCVHRNEISAHKTVAKGTQDLKLLESLDSLSPDEILNLINEKDHPLSELLIGNMIGLTSEQTAAFKTQTLLTSQSEIKNKIITQKNVGEMKEKKNFETTSDDFIGTRYYKFRRRRKLYRQLINKSEVKNHSKIPNEKLYKGFIQPVDLLGRNLTSIYTSEKDIPEDILCLNKYSNNLKNKKQNILQKQKSNSLQESTTIKKNVEYKNKTKICLQAMRSIKSSIKKQISKNRKPRREIANLLIDAKIGPKIRGPRNRRLRSISNSYTKQSFQYFSNEMCTLNKYQICSKQSSFKNRNKLTKVNGYKRTNNKQTRDVKRSKTVTLKQTKIQKNSVVSKKIGKSRITKKILNNKNSTNSNASTTISSSSAAAAAVATITSNNNDNDYSNSNINISVSHGNENNTSQLFKIDETAKNKNVTLIKNRKRKLEQIVSIDSKRSKVEQELHNSFKRDVTKPCKADAITQCSLLKEPLTKNLKSNDFTQDNLHNEQYTFIKIEYSDLKDMKPSMCEIIELDGKTKDHTMPQTSKTYMSYENTVCNIRNSKNRDTKLFTNNVLNTKEQKETSPERVSAFVPVNIPNNDLKIARLRSIGFKPIICNNNDENIDSNNGNDPIIFNSKVLKQNVTEKYIKYTNEESNIVVYMDDNLQYQDIENEDKNSLSIKCKASSSRNCTVKDEQLSKVGLKQEACHSLLSEQDLELPWHGWKKIVTNKDIHWIGC